MRERNRLAREIHDTLAQGLSAIALQLETADALLDSALLDRTLAAGSQRGDRARQRRAAGCRPPLTARAVPSSRR